MHFLEKLDAITAKNNSLVCVGLDSDGSKIPQRLLEETNPVLAFNIAIIEATSDLVQAYKLNLAFYEALGALGYEIMKGTLAAIPSDVITIGDAKRGDIGNTAGMYAKALFDDLGFDAATVSPYLGFDATEPFLRYEEKGVFILALTSNAGSKDFQYLPVDGKPLYHTVVRKIVEWNARGNCGLVVGATHPEELAEVRDMIGDMPILVPGLGAQGGDVEKAVRAGVTDRGDRVLFNSSRAILYASSGEDFVQAARRETERFQSQINRIRLSIPAQIGT